MGCEALRDNSYKVYVDAIRTAVLRNNNDEYLNDVFRGLPSWDTTLATHIVSDAKIAEKHRMAAAKVRMWMEENQDWEHRVAGAMSSHENWINDDNPFVRRVTFSADDEVWESIEFSDKGPEECVLSLVKGDGLKGEIGNLLVGVDGFDVTREDTDTIYENFYTDGETNIFFMNGSAVLFNHPIIALKLGLVEVLRVMVEANVHFAYR